MQEKRGYTLIEIIISIGILALLGAIILVSFLTTRTVQDLTTSGQNVISVLREAQSKTIAGENNTPWGVHLEPQRFVLFNGTSYAAAISTTAHPLPNNIQITNINLAGGGNDITFQRLSGTTNQYGTFNLTATNPSSLTFSISIDASGKAYQTGTAQPPSTNSRLVDLRHRQFNLGWSIQNYTTLTLTFSDPPSPDTINSINMAIYFNADKSKFDWSGSPAIGGQAQILRIHTASLTTTNTILVIDHDCRENNKKLKITISAGVDSRDIATYEADCKTITVGQPYGGVMSEF